MAVEIAKELMLSVASGVTATFETRIGHERVVWSRIFATVLVCSER
jgi:hypothetical protein